MIVIIATVICILLYNTKILKVGKYNHKVLEMNTCNFVKGAAALGVLLHHIAQRVVEPGVLYPFRVIGYLMVALFLFYSGYGLMKSYISKEKYLDGFLKKRLPRVVVPFIIANILFIMIYTIMGREFSLWEILIYIVGINLIDSFKWYIIVIVILYLGFYFVARYLKSSKICIGIFLLVTVCNMICWKTERGGWWYYSNYCFFVGCILGRYYESVFKYTVKRYLSVTLSVGCIFIFTCILKYINNGILGTLSTMLSAVFFVLLCLCILIKVNVGNKCMNFLGGISYEIYLVHGLILNLFSDIKNGIQYTMVCIIVSIMLAYIFSVFIKNIFKVYMKVSSNQSKIKIERT